MRRAVFTAIPISNRLRKSLAEVGKRFLNARVPVYPGSPRNFGGGGVHTPSRRPRLASVHEEARARERHAAGDKTNNTLVCAGGVVRGAVRRDRRPGRGSGAAGAGSASRAVGR